MRIYTVHLRKDESDFNLILVKEGFCWAAFFFDFFWALYYRAWSISLILVMGVFVFIWMWYLGWLTQSLFFLFLTGWRCFVGCHGNDARRAVLKQQAFVETSIVSGHNETSAMRRFLDMGDLQISKQLKEIG